MWEWCLRNEWILKLKWQVAKTNLYPQWTGIEAEELVIIQDMNRS